MNLSQYCGKRIALVMEVQGREVVLRGTIALRLDAKQGRVLQITVADEESDACGSPVFLISEPRWRRQIASGASFDCEYCLDLSCPALEAA